MMINKCPFLNQLRYCYASAEINLNGEEVNIRFNQELNIQSGIAALRFLMMPLCELSQANCSYIVNIFTPSIVYRPCTISLMEGQIHIAYVKPFDDMVIAS